MIFFLSIENCILKKKLFNIFVIIKIAIQKKIDNKKVYYKNRG